MREFDKKTQTLAKSWVEAQITDDIKSAVPEKKLKAITINTTLNIMVISAAGTFLASTEELTHPGLTEERLEIITQGIGQNRKGLTEVVRETLEQQILQAHKADYMTKFEDLPKEKYQHLNMEPS